MKSFCFPISAFTEKRAITEKFRSALNKKMIGALSFTAQCPTDYPGTNDLLKFYLGDL
jgi:hypothetical protein